MRDPPPARHLRADAAGLALVAEVCPPRPHRDRHLDRRLERIDPHLPVAAERDRPDVALAQLVGRDQLVRGGAQLLERVRDRHVVQLGRAVQPLEVVCVAEDRRPVRRVVAALALEHARPVVEPVRQYVDLRVLPGDKLSVVPDEVHCFHDPLLRGVVRPPWSPLLWSQNPQGPPCAGHPPALDRRPILQRRPALPW